MTVLSYLPVLAILGSQIFISSAFTSTPSSLSFGLKNTLNNQSLLKERVSTRLFSKANIIGKYFQLEELEDKETATTEVLLKGDETVEVGETDGPIPTKCTGTWSLSDDNDFKMVLTRTFEAGKQETKNTDIGQFDFQVVRSFSGQMSCVGACAAVTGSMHSTDEDGADAEVGYFNMIDTTDERLKQDRK